MTKAFRSAAFVGIALVDCSAAMAGPPAAPSPIYNWTGPYIGFEAGGIDQRDRFRGGLVGSSSATSGMAGLYAGYNWQLPNNIVLGAEGRIDAFDAKASFGTLDSHSNWTGSVVGRVGYAFSPIVMLYGTGGLVVGNLSQSFPGKSDSATVTGGTFGAGVEINFSRLKGGFLYTPNVGPARTAGDLFLRFDYRHQKFSKADTFGDLRTGICSDIFTVGVALKFDAASPFKPVQ